MPGGDRTGPRGMGPRTGRGAGYCSGYGVPGFANPVWGRGFGGGVGWGRGGGRGFRGGGRGWRHWYYATGVPGWMRFGWDAPAYGYPAPYQQPDPQWEKQDLKNQADALRSELNMIEQRLADLEAAGGTEE